MLVLKRKVGQSIKIGNDIEIHVASVEGEGVRLAIEAPKDVQILRKELFDSIREENEKAGSQVISQAQLLKLLQQQTHKGSPNKE